MLKAYLLENDIEFSKTHDIRRLLNLGSDHEPEWEQFIDESARLTSYAIDARYPGSIATKELAGNAIRICRKMRKSVLAALDLPDGLPL